jgi:hypothetical protein
MNAALRQIRFRAGRTRLRELVLWHRHRGLRPNDVFIGSFPRSGTYWLRFQLFEILTGHAAEFGLIKQSLPWIGNQDQALPVLPEGGRLINTHERYRPEYKKAIYLVRDVRDVVLSIYAREKEVGLFGYPALNDFDSYLVSFSKGQTTPFGSWQNHVTSWLESPLATNSNLLVIRYEDMRRNPEEALTKVVKFLGISADLETIRKVTEGNSVEKMRAREDCSHRVQKGSSEDGRFVRWGKIGGWRSGLSEMQLEIVQESAGQALALMGYVKNGPVGLGEDQVERCIDGSPAR